MPEDVPLAAAGAPPAVGTGAWGFDSPLQPQRDRTKRRGATLAAPLPILFSTERFVPMPLLTYTYHMSRQDTIRLQTESAGVPHSDPKTPVLAWI